MKQIILASGSARRKQILNQANIKHEVIVTNAPEISVPEKGPIYNVTENAKIKANAIKDNHPNAFIIGADTIVLFDDKIIGKPKTKAEAEHTLYAYSEKPLYVYSGVCVINTATGETAADYCRTIVHVGKMTKAAVHIICETLEPLDRAGSFSIEGAGAYIFDNIEGSFYNVLGLPLGTLYDVAKKTGLDLLKE